MSEEAATTPEVKKKKGKLPVIVVLVLLLAGGGFFAMKSKAPKKPEIKMGATEPLGEFLVNLSGGSGNLYLRTEISLQFREGFKPEEFEANKDAIKDAVGQILSGKTLSETSATQRMVLKKELTGAINAILIAHSTPEEKKADEELEKLYGSKPDKDDAKADTKGDQNDSDSKKDKKDKKDDKGNWDSPTGPVLNLYFTSFATQ